MYEKIFTRGRINGCELKNRVILPAMDDSLGSTGGDISPRAIEYYATRARGGCGLIITAYTAVCGPELSGIAMPGQAHLLTYENGLAMHNLADRIHEYGAKVFVQLHHPGRKTQAEYNEGRQPVSCSARTPAMPEGTPLARELTGAEIKKIVECFAQAAEFAYWAGIDGVEVHCAHHYLLSQFINPAKNIRTDEYGGSLKNRCRIVVEIMRAIRQRVPARFPITVRINGYDGEGLEGEGDLDYMGKVAKYLSENGADAIHISLGSKDNCGTPEMVSGWRNFIYEHYRKCVKVPIYGPNEIKTPEEAEAILEAGLEDFVVLGRQHTADPEWANKAKAGQAQDIRPCISCNYCLHLVTAEHSPIRCSVNPLVGREIDNLDLKPGEGTIVVIGAGPGGIEAALTAAKRGFKVILTDKNSEIGGALQLANKAPSKFRIDNLIQYYRRQIDQNKNIELRLNDEITPENLVEIDNLNPYAVVLATGGKPIIPPVEGVERAVTANDVLCGKVKISGKKVIVIGGGMTGLETAELLAESNNEIALLEMLPAVGRGICINNVLKTTKILDEKGVKIKTSHKLETINESTVVVQDLKQNSRSEMECDTVVLAIGVIPENSLLEKLEARFTKVVNVGDSSEAGKIATAVHDGYYYLKHV
ncbi:MAG: FAD-dependent oxidoreductase [Sporolactobacillus sp.]